MGRDQLEALVRILQDQLAEGPQGVIVGSWSIRWDKDIEGFYFDKCEWGGKLATFDGEKAQVVCHRVRGLFSLHHRSEGYKPGWQHSTTCRVCLEQLSRVLLHFFGHVIRGRTADAGTQKVE